MKRWLESILYLWDEDKFHDTAHEIIDGYLIHDE